jgi:hypothetical protein
MHGLHLVKWNQVFRNLHDDARYTALLRNMNLPVG